MNIDEILVKLDKVSQVSHNRYKACCPAHDDKNPSFYITETDDGKILMHCFTGCTKDEILGSLGIGIKDLFPEGATHHRKRPIDHDKRPYILPTTREYSPDCYYNAVIKIAEADKKLGISPTSKDRLVIKEAESYINHKKSVREIPKSNKSLDYYSEKRNKGEKLSATEMKEERKLWLQKNRRYK